MFVDDFIVYSSTSKHLACLRLMLQEKEVYLNPFKCLFGVDKGEVMGHVVSNKGIEMTGSKIKAILKVKAPNNVNKVANFLGFVDFYRRFITKFAKLAAPLFVLSNKGFEIATKVFKQ